MGSLFSLLDTKNPGNSIYFKASFVLRVLYKESPIEIFDLFLKTKELEEMSYTMFYYCLLWLYLLDTIEVKDSLNVFLKVEKRE